MGLINKVVPDAELKAATREFALEIAERGPFALASVKAAFNARHGGVSGLSRMAHDLLLRAYLETRREQGAVQGVRGQAQARPVEVRQVSSAGQRVRPFLTLHHPAHARRYYEQGVWQADTFYALLARHAAEPAGCGRAAGRAAHADLGASCRRWVDGVAADLARQGPRRRRSRVDLDVEPRRGDRDVPRLRARGPCLQSLAASHLHLRRDRPAAGATERPRAADGARLGRGPRARRSSMRCLRASPSLKAVYTPESFAGRGSERQPGRQPIPTASSIWPSPPARPARPSASCTRTTRCSPTRATWCATGGTGPTRCCSACRRCRITSPGWAWRSGWWRAAGS